MTVTKISKNRIRVESEFGLIYTPSNQVYRVVECSCPTLVLIDECTGPVEHIAELLSLI